MGKLYVRNVDMACISIGYIITKYKKSNSRGYQAVAFFIYPTNFLLTGHTLLVHRIQCFLLRNIYALFLAVYCCCPHQGEFHSCNRID